MIELPLHDSTSKLRLAKHELNLVEGEIAHAIAFVHGSLETLSTIEFSRSPVRATPPKSGTLQDQSNPLQISLQKVEDTIFLQNNGQLQAEMWLVAVNRRAKQWSLLG